MRFWDSSALVPLVVDEASTTAALATYEADPDVLTWWGTELEIISALTRREREGRLAVSGMSAALGLLDALELAWQEIHPGTRLREVGARLLRTHPLRAADALQLAAAIIAAEERPASLALVTLDGRLAAAAEREGFPVTVPGA